MRTKLYEKPVAVAMASRRPARRGVQGRAGTVLLENVYARPGSPCATWTSTIVRRYGVKLMTLLHTIIMGPLKTNVAVLGHIAFFCYKLMKVLSLLHEVVHTPE